jgi:hypothetical protein
MILYVEALAAIALFLATAGLFGYAGGTEWASATTG